MLSPTEREVRYDLRRHLEWERKMRERDMNVNGRDSAPAAAAAGEKGSEGVAGYNGDE